LWIFSVLEQLTAYYDVLAYDEKNSCGIFTMELDRFLIVFSWKLEEKLLKKIFINILWVLLKIKISRGV
jgi:hypothetical protein